MLMIQSLPARGVQTEDDHHAITESDSDGAILAIVPPVVLDGPWPLAARVVVRFTVSNSIGCLMLQH